MDQSDEAAKVFGAVMRAYRTAKDMSQARLADLSDLDRTYISLLERGLRQPSLSTMIAVAKSLGVSLTDLAQEIEHRLG